MKPVTGAVLACALSLAGGAAAGCSAPIVMGTGQLEPYGYFDAHKRYVGMDVEMIRAIIAEAGCTLSYAPLMPDGRNLLLFEQGKIDLMAGASRTAARLKWARFSVAYRQETIGLFAVADRRGAPVASFAEFVGQPLTLLAPRAGWYGAEYERHKARLKAGGRLSQFDNLAQGVRMLAARRAQFILGDAAGVEHAAARLGVTLRPLPFWLVQAPVHLMFSRATMSDADVARIDAAIVRLQQRGVLGQIQRGYGPR
jgi:polar amino acid transport system substrate-binding protein